MSAEDWLTQDGGSLYDDGLTGSEGITTYRKRNPKHYGFETGEERAVYCEKKATLARTLEVKLFWLSEATKARRDEH